MTRNDKIAQLICQIMVATRLNEKYHAEGNHDAAMRWFHDEIHCARKLRDLGIIVAGFDHVIDNLVDYP